MGCNMRLAVCVDCPSQKKGMSDIPTALQIFFHLPESHVNLHGLEQLQHRSRNMKQNFCALLMIAIPYVWLDQVHCFKHF